MDIVKQFEEIEIPLEISNIISCYVHGWKKCVKCRETFDDTFYWACSKQTVKCWYCRQKKKASLSFRWESFLRKHWGVIHDMRDIGLKPMFEFAEICIATCDDTDHVYTVYVVLVMEFVAKLGIPGRVLTQLITTE